MSDEGPLRLHEGRVEAGWIDEYGHMNMSRYLEACDHATYAFWQRVNDGKPLEERDGGEYAVVETHINYLGELREGEAFFITTQLLDFDAKRFQIFHDLYKSEDGALVATNEVMALGFSLETRGLEPFNDAVMAHLERLRTAHGKLERPKNAGRSIAIKRRDQKVGAA